MSTVTENACFRCRHDCTPVANIAADEEAKSFVCVGFNKKEDRALPQDRFTLCWKNKAVDERGHWDKRDLLDTVSVIVVSKVSLSFVQIRCLLGQLRLILCLEMIGHWDLQCVLEMHLVS